MVRFLFGGGIVFIRVGLVEGSEVFTVKNVERGWFVGCVKVLFVVFWSRFWFRLV